MQRIDNHDEMEALASGYVLAVLEADEVAAFERHVASCPECTALVAELRRVVDTLPLTVPQVEPPSGLRSRVLSAVRAEAAGSRVEAPPAPPRARRPFFARPLALAAAAAVLVTAAVGAASWAFVLQDRLETSERRVASIYDAMVVLGEADRRWEFSGSAIEPGARGILAYSGRHRAATLMVWGLPEPTEGAYTAWTAAAGIREGAGTLRRANDGLWVMVRRDVDAMDSVGITLHEDSAPAIDVLVVQLVDRPAP